MLFKWKFSNSSATNDTELMNKNIEDIIHSSLSRIMTTYYSVLGLLMVSFLKLFPYLCEEEMLFKWKFLTQCGDI